MRVSHALPGIDLEHDVACRARDGVALATDVYRPADMNGPLPVLLMRLPYGKECAETFTYLHPAWYARQGYVVAVQDVRGRFASEGAFEPFVHEAEDGYDAVEWAAALPGSNGQVGMYGFSYAGITQLEAASLAPPHLAALAPAFMAADYYDGWLYPGGVLSLSFALFWGLLLAGEDARHRGDIAGYNRLRRDLGNVPALAGFSPIADLPVLGEPGVAPYLADWLGHPERDEYWRVFGRALVDRLDRIRIPSLHIEGLYDVFSRGGIQTHRRLQAVGGQSLLVMGPWQHMPWLRKVGDIDFGPQATPHLDVMQVEWFDRVLKGGGRAGGEPIARGLPSRRARVFAMGTNRWLEYPDWPGDHGGTTYYLRSEGAANTVWGDGRLDAAAPGAEPADVLVHDPFAPVKVAGGQSCCDDSLAPMGPRAQDTVEDKQGVCVYSGSPVPSGVRVVGLPRARLYLSSDADELAVHVRLCWVRADGRSYNLSEGTCRVAWPVHDSGEDRVRVADVDLGPVALELAPGESLRLHVVLSAFPAYQVHSTRAGNQSRIPLTEAHMEPVAVLHDGAHPSHVVLPVRVGQEGGDVAAPPWRGWFGNSNAVPEGEA